MLKLTRAMVFSLVIMAPASAVAENAEIEAKINELNEQSVKKLGVSLTAIAYLMNASPDSYIPMWHLEKSGDIAFVRELEVAGYVKTEIRRGLPDGHEKNESFMRIIPLTKGDETRRCLFALRQHNNSLKTDALR